MAPATVLPTTDAADPVDAALPDEVKHTLEELDADDPDYSLTHTHPRSHPHEKPPAPGGVLSFLYAFEGGDPESEVDVVHEEMEEGRKPPKFR